MSLRAMKHLTTNCLWLMTLLAGSVVTRAAPQPREPDFTTQIRPILAENCFKCHGPDDAARKSKLRLDRPETATQPAKSGKRAIVPGKPQESELIFRITAADP